MNEIKYIYFEIKYVKGVGETEPTIENENVLLIKPKTNSSGVWAFCKAYEKFTALRQPPVIKSGCDKCEELQAEVNRCYEAIDAKKGIIG